MEEHELDARIEKGMRRVLWKWILTYGGVVSVILFSLNLLWTELVRPSIIKTYAREAEVSRDRAANASKETEKILAQMRGDLLVLESTRKEFQQYLKEIKDGALAKQVAKEFQADTVINARFKALHSNLSKLQQDVWEQMEEFRDKIRFGKSFGTISHSSSKETQTHKFDFPVRNAWVEVPFPNCVDSIRVINTTKNTVTVEIEYPKEKRCNVIGYYHVWATSLWSVGSSKSTIRSLEKPSEKSE